jgi:hypothetical protein
MVETLSPAHPSAILQLQPGNFLEQLRHNKRIPIVRALSWKQPYADLMLTGKVETRKWKTSYRGWVLICASQKAYTQYQVLSISGNGQYDRVHKSIVDLYSGKGMLHCNKDMQFGKAIAVGYLTSCRLMQSSQKQEDETFVSYNGEGDLYCHYYEQVRAIKPFDWKGSQGWRNVPISVVQKIEII